MIIEISYPSADLMPNRKNGYHWSKTLQSKNTAKNEAFYLVKSKYPSVKLSGKTPLLITFVQRDKINRDLDGLLSASKSALDGMAMAFKIDDRFFEPITLCREYGDVAKTIIKIGD